MNYTPALFASEIFDIFVKHNPHIGNLWVKAFKENNRRFTTVADIREYWEGRLEKRCNGDWVKFEQLSDQGFLYQFEFMVKLYWTDKVPVTTTRGSY